MKQLVEFEQAIRRQLPELNIRVNEPMHRHTSFRIGGPCDLMLQPATAQQLQRCLQIAKETGIHPLVLGAGSNVLVPDDGIRGAVIVTKDALTAIRLEHDTQIVAQCGVSLAKLSQFAREHGLSGLEFAQGIPGTVGGAIYMNAGAYDGEIKQVAAETEFLTMDGTTMHFAGQAQGFSYRMSAFQKLDGIILESRFQLQPADRDQILEKMQDFAQRRRSKQPLELPSAGSTFKRPQGYYAAALIEQAGLKGFRIGGAAVSEKHAGFVVNLGGATAQDVLRVIAAVQQRVLEHSGVQLEPEVRLLSGE